MSKALIHVGWFVLAGAAFFAGGKLLAPAANSQPTKANPAVGAAGSGTLTEASSGKKADTLTLPALTALKEVEDFVKRYASGGDLTPEQMQAAIGEVLAEMDPVKSSLMFSLLMEKLTPDNASLVLKEVQSKMPGFEGFRYVGLLAFKWGSLDGPAAMTQAMKQTGPGRFVGVAGLAGWAGKDPEGAMKWLDEQKLEGGWEKGMMQRGLISGLARGDAQQATDYVSKITDKDERSRLTQAIAEEKLKQGIDGAASWALSLQDPEMKRGAFDSVADQMYRADKTKAAQYITSNATQPYAVNAAGEYGRRLAQENPQEAIIFTKSLPAGDSRTKAYQGSFREWAGKDPEAASTMLQGMEPGADRDGAAAGLAPAVTRDEPEAGLAWAETISSEQLRQSTLTDVLRIQYARDPDAAMGYMTTNGWTEEQQKSVRVQQDNRTRFGPLR